jgi:hypothetical protein
MTQLEWQKLEAIVAHMTPEERARLVALVEAAPSASVAPREDRLLGSMSDIPEIMDAIVEEAYFARENHPLRQPNRGKDLT